MGAWDYPREWGVLDRFTALFGDGVADNPNVAIIKLFGHNYATTEIPKIFEFDPVTLETVGSVELNKIVPELKDLRTMTPHPLHDKDGTLWNLGMLTTSSGLKAAVFKVPPPETEAEKRNPWLKTQLVATIPSRNSMSFSYFHSFFMTENYLIYPEMPWMMGNLFNMLWEFVFLG